MKKSLTWRLIVIVAILIWSLIYITPSINPDLPSWWKRFLPQKSINLGLDLKGGIHMILEADTQKAIEAHMDGVIEELKREAKGEKIKLRDIRKRSFGEIEILLEGERDKERLQEVVGRRFPDFSLSFKRAEAGIEAVLTLSSQALSRLKELTLEQALETIRNRVDQFGVAEPEIRKQEEGRILVQLPGIQDVERAKEIIGKTALLEFKLVDEEHSLEEALKGNLPPGSQILYHVSKDPKTGQVTKVPYLLKKKALLTGSRIVDARVQINQQYNEPYVTLSFDAMGARLFERITEENVHKRLAIVLDGNVYSAPVIQEKISGGRAQITGRFTLEEAKDLAIVLRAGALPAPVKIVEERTVGPSLGKDSIDAGLK
ncbi:MAG: protein translocase subunit SecD, partial [Desulfatiglandales bacterium]